MNLYTRVAILKDPVPQIFSSANRNLGKGEKKKGLSLAPASVGRNPGDWCDLVTFLFPAV